MRLGANSGVSVIMIGTSLTTMGGIATVVQGYVDAGLFERAPVRYVVTHRDGTSTQKLLCALRSYWEILGILLRPGRLLFHIHLSSRASFWRKLPIMSLCRLRGHPYIIHLHGSEFMQFYDVESGPFGKRLIRNAFNRAARVLALSPEWRDNVARFSRNPEIRVLPNGVPVASSCPERAGSRRPVRLLFLGRLGRRKGIYDLLAVLGEIDGDPPAFELIAAGDGEIDEVRRQASELGLSDAVRVPGWIDANAKRQFLESSDIFVLPSHAEGLPMSLLEAMAAGLPVVCSTVGGIPLAVTNEIEGLLIEPGDIAGLRTAVQRLIDDPELRLEYGRQAHARARAEFSVDSCVNRLIEIYVQMGVNAA